MYDLVFKNDFEEACKIAEEKEKENERLKLALKKAEENVATYRKLADVQDQVIKQLETKTSLLEDICRLKGVELPYGKKGD